MISPKGGLRILMVVVGLLIISLVGMLRRQYRHSSVDQYRDSATINIGTGRTTLKALVADSEYKRQYGLMFRGQLERGEGMLFVFDDEITRTFRMKNTYVPLDMIFISSDGTIKSIHAGAKPMDETAISSIYPAKYVIEVNSGRANQAKLHTGMVVDIAGQLTGQSE